MSKKVLSLILVLSIFLIGIVGFIFETVVPVNKDNSNYVSFEVKSGQSSTEIVNNLAKENLVRDRYSAYVVSTLLGNNFYANDYALSPSMNTYEIFEALMQPTTNITPENGLVLTVVEGDNIDNIAQNISDNSIHSKQEVLDAWNDEEFLNEIIDKYWFVTDDVLNDDVMQPLEGMFTPSTYFFNKDASIEEITFTMLDYTNEVYSEYENQDFGDYTFYEILSFASIIERETNNEADKYKVSGVYHNRIKEDMPLQADITVLYAMGEHKDKVLYKDLEIDSPYNLYKNKGLTPSPIASPSLSAIDAAINPEESNYLYYYNTPDTGETIYSETFEEHKEVVNKYQ